MKKSLGTLIDEFKEQERLKRLEIETPDWNEAVRHLTESMDTFKRLEQSFIEEYGQAEYDRLCN